MTRFAPILVAYLLATFIFGQSNWKFDHLTTDNGLSTGTVNCVFKDSRGFIWIGTVDGLNRYDGYTIQVFKNDKKNPKSLSGNIVSALAEDANGDIWIGTRNAGITIFHWDDETFEPIADLSVTTIPSGHVRSIHRTTDQNMLIGIEGGGILKYNPQENKITRYTERSGLSNNTIFSIINISPDEYMISSAATIIDVLNTKTGTFSHIPYSPQYEATENSRKVIHYDKNGILWLGTDGNGLVKINTNTGEESHYTASNSDLKSNIVTALFEDTEQNLYIGTDGQGINVLNKRTGTFTFIQSSLLDPSSLSSDAIYQIYQDNADIVWVSTFRGGVNFYSPYKSKFRLYNQIPYENNSLSFSSVIDVLTTSDGYLWIGTDGGGLDRVDLQTGNFAHYRHSPTDPTSISTNVAIALEEDNDGNIWVGTYSGGLNKLDRNTGRFTRYLPEENNPSSINGKNVWEILQDSEGTLWFGLLNGGLDRYNANTNSFTHFTTDGTPNTISSNLLISMLEDSKRNFWIGTEDAGLNHFDRTSETFTHYSHRDGDSTTLLNNNVRTLFEDSKGQLWIGTAEGANIMNVTSREIRNAKVNKLLPSLVINGIQEDENGNLWIGTNKGISKYNPSEHTIQNFSKSDGLQGNEFNYTSSTKSDDGTMYFGGVKGLNTFNPKEIQLNPFEPNVIISDIKLFEKSLTQIVDKNGNLLFGSSIQSMKDITFSHDQNVVEINFSSLDFTTPSKNQYRYKLENFDKDWVTSSATKRSASYTNLDPGSYTFRVQGTNSDGIWSSHEATFEIVVLPPWWETGWFRISISAFVVLIGFLFFRWRAKTIQHQKQELNRQIEEATSRVFEQNDALKNEQNMLSAAIEETNEVIKEAVESGNFSARISTDNKTGEWKLLGDSINQLFDSITNPFKEINEIIGAMASSNLTLRYKEEAKGDILRLTSSLNYALDNLSELIKTIRGNTNTIGSSSEEMLISSQEMNIGTGEIATSTSELSNGAQEQVRRIDEASSTLENILQLSSEVGEQAKSINQASENGVQLSEGSQAEMSSMDKSIKQMESVSSETSESIETLQIKSTEISGILNSIKEISVETNMLALNAAIEASKAGDAGRGFAVVADQIRRLAENANTFTTEIEMIVDEVQASIDAVSNKIVEMSEGLEGSVIASKNASSSFSQLASSYQQTFSLSEQIVSQSDKQYQMLKGVVQLMESVVVIAEEAAAGTEQIASSSNELSSGMMEYQEKTKRVSEIIDQLNQEMSQFKLD